MKTERVVLLTTPAFKAFLAREARKEGVSIAELVRARCERAGDPADDQLVMLLPELRRSLALAQKSLKRGLAEADSVLHELRTARTGANSAVTA
jgi:hypothetical protein